jgi:putative peptide zinc metalloprotease protein
MSESLFSSSWYRVADIRPRLRNHARIYRHVYRGQIWYVLQDQTTGRFHRFSTVANFVIGLMDGRRSLHEIWLAGCDQLGDDAPTQDEVIGLLSSLHRADVLQTDKPIDMMELHERKHQIAKQKLKQYIQNPLSLRFPLYDPDRLLIAMQPLTRHIFSWFAALLWVAVVGWAVVMVGVHWEALTRDMSDRVFAADNLLVMSLVFPLTKLLHEFGHAIATRQDGGEVHEMGVMLLVFLPVPYVDASASSGFRNKYRRMLVGASGMLSELFLAGLAMLVWVNVEPGLVRAVAYNVMLVAGISTVLFNANPLLRFDGYYILADWIEIPNLAQRANNYLGYLTRRYVFGSEDVAVPETAPGERGWFVFYAITSFFYRIFISISIAAMVATQYFVIGILLAIWSVYLMIVLPLAKKLAWLFTGSDLSRNRMRAISVTTLMVAVILAVVVGVPAPSWSRTEGVASVPIDNVVRAGADGVINRVVAVPNATVRKGDVLMTMEDPDLAGQVLVLSAQLAEQQAKLTSAVHEKVYASIIREEIAAVSQRLAAVRRKVAELVVRSPAEGIFVVADAQDLPGRYVHRGELVAYVMDFSRMTVRAVIPQSDIDLVRKMTRRVELRTIENIPRVLHGTVIRAVPAATDELPSLALSAHGGGEISLDPTRSENPRNSEPKAASTLFHFELELSETGAIQHLGSRIYVRFEREPEPFATQVYRVIRRIFLNKFNV